MNASQLSQIESILERHTSENGVFSTAIPALQLYKATTSNVSTPTLYNPSVCLLVRGAKQIMLNNDIYLYGESEFLIVTVDLPVVGKVTLASEGEPYLALKIDIDVSVLSELLISMQYPVIPSEKVELGLSFGMVDEQMGDAIIRLLSLLDDNEDSAILAEQTTREFFYRILRSEYGHQLAQVAFNGSHVERMSGVIRKIKADFRDSIHIEELAALAGMSVSGLYAHFKSVTTMSPLQFQKQLRLIEARNLMLTEGLDATSAAYQVGYESPSQFSREYTRMFGNPPKRDVVGLKMSMTDGKR